MKRHLALVAVTVTAVTGVAAYTQVSWTDHATTPVTTRVTRGAVVRRACRHRPCS